MMPRVSDEHLEARRRQILDAALVRFSRQGFHQTPMQAIFEEAELSPGAVYRYFKSKDEIVHAIASETLDALTTAVEPRPEGEPPLGPVEVLERLLGAVAAVEHRDQKLRLAVQVWGEALHNAGVAAFLHDTIDRLRAQVGSDLRDAQRHGTLDPALDPDAAATVLVALAQGFVVQSTAHQDLDATAFLAAARALMGGASRSQATGVS